MKKISKKSKSFTLIEILVAVTIFAIVSSLVMATFAAAMRSKSKTKAVSQLRAEGGKIMVEIQDMVQKGNGSDVPSNIGVVIIGKPACTNITDGTSLGSFQTDYKNWRTNRIISFTSNQAQLSKAVYRPTDTPPYYEEVARRTNVPINSADVSITNASITGVYKNGSCAQATSITVSFTVTAATTGATGAPTSVQLSSTFTSKYPYPDKGADSVPPNY